LSECLAAWRGAQRPQHARSLCHHASRWGGSGCSSRPAAPEALAPQQQAQRGRRSRIQRALHEFGHDDWVSQTLLRNYLAAVIQVRGPRAACAWPTFCLPPPAAWPVACSLRGMGQPQARLSAASALQMGRQARGQLRLQPPCIVHSPRCRCCPHLSPPASGSRVRDPGWPRGTPAAPRVLAAPGAAQANWRGTMVRMRWRADPGATVRWARQRNAEQVSA
jgi:hypothetical protein